MGMGPFFEQASREGPIERFTTVHSSDEAPSWYRRLESKQAGLHFGDTECIQTREKAAQILAQEANQRKEMRQAKRQHKPQGRQEHKQKSNKSGFEP